MSGIQELNRFNIAQPQNEMNAVPPTIASAATIAPVHGLTFLTGTVQVGVITPPMAGFHILVLCFTDNAPGAFVTTGNIKTAYTPITNRPILMIFDPLSAKYWVQSVV